MQDAVEMVDDVESSNGLVRLLLCPLQDNRFFCLFHQAGPSCNCVASPFVVELLPSTTCCLAPNQEVERRGGEDDDKEEVEACMVSIRLVIVVVVVVCVSGGTLLPDCREKKWPVWRVVVVFGLFLWSPNVSVAFRGLCVFLAFLSFRSGWSDCLVSSFSLSLSLWFWLETDLQDSLSLSHSRSFVLRLLVRRVCDLVSVYVCVCVCVVCLSSLYVIR